MRSEDHLTLSKARDNLRQSQIWGISQAAAVNYHTMHSFCCKRSYSGFCSLDYCRPNVGQTLTCVGQSCINGVHYSFSHGQPFKCKLSQEWYNLTSESALSKYPAVISFCFFKAVRSRPLHSFMWHWFMFDKYSDNDYVNYRPVL